MRHAAELHRIEHEFSALVAGLELRLSRVQMTRRLSEAERDSADRAIGSLRAARGWIPGVFDNIRSLVADLDDLEQQTRTA